MESIQRYWKRTDKMYLLLCLFSSAMAVLALSSWAAKQGSGFAVDELTGQITGIGDYRRALVQAGAAGIGLVIALLLSCIDYRSLVKVWPVHLNTGLKVSINTDNRTVSNTSLTKELQFIQNTYGIQEEEIRLMMKNAVDTAFATDEVKARLYSELGIKG